MPNPAPYPLFLTLARKYVLVVGGGAVGARKTQGLLDAGARVTVVSPAFAPAFDKLKPLTFIRARYAPTHMRYKKWRLVFAASDIPAVNSRIQKDADAANIPCCRCDNPERGDFANGATAAIGGVLLSVSTGGASPGLAAKIRDQAAGAIDPLLADLADLHRAWRPQIKKRIHTIEQRKILLQRLAGDEMIARLRRHGRKGAQQLLKHWLAELSAVKTAPQKSPRARSRPARKGTTRGK